MEGSCPRCEAGPANIEGHDDLFMQSFVGSAAMLKCRACGSLWTRTADPAKGFAWKRADAYAGSLLP